MALSGRRESADVIRARIGPDAHYSRFKPPSMNDEAPRAEQQWPWGRLLLGASLVSLVVVLVVAALVALGF
jgi:hypothetical protein